MDIKAMIFDLVKCNYQGKVEEIHAEGVYVKYKAGVPDRRHHVFV